MSLTEFEHAYYRRQLKPAEEAATIQCVTQDGRMFDVPYPWIFLTSFSYRSHEGRVKTISVPGEGEGAEPVEINERVPGMWQEAASASLEADEADPIMLNCEAQVFEPVLQFIEQASRNSYEFKPMPLTVHASEVLAAWEYEYMQRIYQTNKTLIPQIMTQANQLGITPLIDLCALYIAHLANLKFRENVGYYRSLDGTTPETNGYTRALDDVLNEINANIVYDEEGREVRKARTVEAIKATRIDKIPPFELPPPSIPPMHLQNPSRHPVRKEPIPVRPIGYDGEVWPPTSGPIYDGLMDRSLVDVTGAFVHPEDGPLHVPEAARLAAEAATGKGTFP